MGASTGTEAPPRFPSRLVRKLNAFLQPPIFGIERRLRNTPMRRGSGLSDSGVCNWARSFRIFRSVPRKLGRAHCLCCIRADVSTLTGELVLQSQ